MTIKKSVLIVSIIISFSFSTGAASTNVVSDIDYLQSWKSSYLDHMTPQELQLLGNLIHLLHANAIIEFKIRQFSTPIVRLNQSIRKNIDQYKDTAEDITLLKTLIERLSFVVSTRTIYNQTLTTCTTHYNQNPTPIIEAALENMQLYAQTALRNWADEKNDETNFLLQKSSQAMGNAVQHFQGASQLHRAMSMGQLPLQLRQEIDEINKSLLVLSVIASNNPEIYAVAEDVINNLNETSDHVAKIVGKGEAIYRQFYTIIYDKLMSSPAIAQSCYATTLFSMHGLLPEEYQSLLPDPNHVFEHMLKTTKMYTQTEFLPLQ